MSTVRTRDWADVLYEHAPREQTARRLVAQLRACEVAALAFCRLLERWARGDADPCTPGKRQAALRRAADRAETALARLNTSSHSRSSPAPGSPYHDRPSAISGSSSSR